jgi:hypothetical protein
VLSSVSDGGGNITDMSLHAGNLSATSAGRVKNPLNLLG